MKKYINLLLVKLNSSLGIFCFLFIYNILMLLILQPNVTGDSYDIIMQIVGKNYSSWQPLAYGLLTTICIYIFNSPYFIAFIHITLFSLVITLILIKLRKIIFIPNFIIIIILLLLSLPPIHLMLISIWKDIPYTIACLVLLYFTLLYTTNTKKNLITIGILLVGITIILFRHNGILYLFFFFLCISSYHLFYKNYRSLRNIFLLLFITYFISFGIQKTIEKIVPHVPSSEQLPAIASMMDHIASYLYYNPSIFSTNELKELNSMCPTINSWNYNKFLSDPPYFISCINNIPQFLEKYTFLKKISVQLIVRDPKPFLKNRIHKASMFYNLNRSYSFLNTACCANMEFTTDHLKNRLQLLPTYGIQRMNPEMTSNFITQVLLKINFGILWRNNTFFLKYQNINFNNTVKYFLLWSPSFYILILFIVMCFYYFIYKETRILFLIIPSFFGMFFSVLPVIPGQDIRYVFLLYPLSYIFIPIMIYQIIQKKLNK